MPANTKEYTALFGEEQAPRGISTPVGAYKDGELVMSFRSQLECALALGTAKSYVSAVLHGQKKTAKGYELRSPELPKDIEGRIKRAIEFLKSFPNLVNFYKLGRTGVARLASRRFEEASGIPLEPEQMHKAFMDYPGYPHQEIDYEGVAPYDKKGLHFVIYADDPCALEMLYEYKKVLSKTPGHTIWDEKIDRLYQQFKEHRQKK